MYQILQSTHSGLRWIVIALILIIVISAALGLMQKRTYTPGTRKLVAAGTGIVHLQLLLGIVLFFMSPKVQFSGNVMSDDVFRFFTLEHTVMMVFAVILVTVGSVKAKRALNDKGAFRRLFWYFLIALLIILAAIPWPFREGLGGGWF
jgi:hypothetical protein